MANENLPIVTQGAPATAPQPLSATPQPSAPQSNITPDQKNKLIQAEKGRRQRRHLMLGCFAFFLIVILFFVITLIVFLTQAKAGQTNPILKLLGISEANLVDSLISLTNIGFGLFAFVAFIGTIIGLFKILIVKKEDIRGKRSGIVTMIVGMIVFTGLIFGWIATYLYLSGIAPLDNDAKIPLAEQIITEPADLSALVAPVMITFDASRTKVGENSSYVWDFGDGSIKGTGAKVSHKYTTKPENEENRFKVTLTITSFKGGQAQKQSAELFVLISNIKPEAEFKMTPQEGEVPLKVSFDAAKSKDPDGEITAYDWDFNDDGEFQEASGDKVAHTFEKAGTYTVKLRVTDNNNQFTIVEQPLIVKSVDTPQPAITSNNRKTKYYANVSYIFSGEESESPFGQITKYKWDLGDKTEANTKTVEHSYKKDGNYTITLEVTDETGQKGETTLDIEVRPPEAAPDAKIKTTPAIEDNATELPGAIPFKVYFDASGTTDSDNNIVDYRWDFDSDGQIDETGKEANFTYDKVGKYQVSLFVTDADDNEDQATITVMAEEQGLRADLKASQISGEIPMEVSFDASGSSYPGGKIISYEWDFGDGSPTRISEARINYTYTKVGEFTARVTAIANDGTKATDTLNIIVRTVSLTACYTASVKAGNAPLTVTFNPTCSKGTIAKYLWDFQGATSTERKPTYTFKNPGQYKVTLKVTDSDNVTAQFSDIIVVKGTKTN